MEQRKNSMSDIHTDKEWIALEKLLEEQIQSASSITATKEGHCK